jgi:hypothetical protein
MAMLVDIRYHVDEETEEAYQNTKMPLDDLVLGGTQMLSLLELSHELMSGYVLICRRLNIVVRVL